MTSLSPINIKWKSRIQTKWFIIHDAHTPPSVENGREYLQFKGRKMGLLDIGYNFIIERDGRTIETRPREAMGSATPGLSQFAVDICLLGGRTEDAIFENNITFGQKVATMRLFDELYGLWPNAEIVGHDEKARFIRRDCKCPCWEPEDIRQDYKMWKATGALP